MGVLDDWRGLAYVAPDSDVVEGWSHERNAQRPIVLSRQLSVFAGGTTLNQIEFATVGSYWNAIEARITRNRLADEGIDVFLSDEFIVSTCWLYANAIGGIKVQVPREQLPLAQDILARGKSDILADDPRTPTGTDQRVCHNCGSPELYRERFSIRFVFLLWIILGVPIPVPSTAMECFDCGSRLGPPTTFRFHFGLNQLLFLLFVVAFTLSIMRIMGHHWFN